MREIDEQIINFLKVLADQTRLEILEFLKNNETSASDIQDAINKSQSTVSQQLKILITSDLVSFEREGTKKIYKIKDPKIFDILAIIKSYISGQYREKIDELSSMDILDTLL